MNYTKLISKKKQYKYSVNICLDLRAEERLTDFIPNLTTTEIIREYLGGGELDAELDKWLNDWTFSGSKTFAIKILLLNLLLTQRIDVPNAYKASSVTLKVAALVYNLDAGKLQLDHLEANIVNPATPQAYYLSHDSEKRQKDVNGYIGNFMILDATDNNQKNNVPLCNAMQYYSGIKTSWLIEDINSMIADPLYFDVQTNVPREEFFIERSRRLKKYFKAYLGKQLDDKTITIDF